MMIYILFVSWVVTTYAADDPQLYPIKTRDLKAIVDAVKKDVDRHLKMAYASRRIDPLSLPDSPELSTVVDTENGDEYRNFMKVIQDSMNRHLIKNLGQPSDAENDGSTVYTEQVTNVDEDNLKPSQILEIRVGSSKGIPGVNFPDYTDIPITSFTCSEKPHLPGFYADLDTGCQVFHVCWPDRRESFLCPMGTTFNQALKVCDYWYNSNCSLAPYYYATNLEPKPDLSEAKNENVNSMINTLLEKTDSVATQKPDSTTYNHATSDSIMPFISTFMPMKAKIVVYPKTETQRLKIVTTASIGESKKPDFKRKPLRNDSSSKHSRVPRSLQYTKSAKDADIRNFLEYPVERTLFHFYEALDRTMFEIESNETLSVLSEHARRIVKNIKFFFSFFIEPLKHFTPNPGSEVYKTDMEMKKVFEGEMWTDLIAWVAALMKHFREMKAKYLEEQKALNPEPLTNLNPRFVIKPAIQQTSGLKNKKLPPLAKRVKIAVTYPLKLKHEDRLNIHPETKKILLKSYMKLFKRKYKHA